MKGRASEAGKAQNEDCNLQGGKKRGGKKSNLGAEPRSSWQPHFPGSGAFPPRRRHGGRQRPQGCSLPHKHTARKPASPRASRGISFRRRIEPRINEISGRNLARWLQPRDLESPEVIQAILQGRFHNFCLRLANKKPQNTDLTGLWQ